MSKNFWVEKFFELQPHDQLLPNFFSEGEKVELWQSGKISVKFGVHSSRISRACPNGITAGFQGVAGFVAEAAATAALLFFRMVKFGHFRFALLIRHRGTPCNVE